MLNAADPIVARMADLCDGEVVFYGLGQELPAIAAHRAKGGRALFLRDNRVMLASGSVEALMAELPRSPAAGGENEAEWFENLLAGIGAAAALGIPIELIRVGIETFVRDQYGKKPSRVRERKVANQ